MKKTLLLLISFCGSILLHGCGTATSTPPPPPPLATHFSVTAPSPTPTAGTSFNITVTALDASNAPVSNYAGTVDFSSSDPRAVLPPPSPLSNGKGTFSVTLKTASGQTITAMDAAGALTPGSSSPITVSPAAASQFFISAPSNADAGSAFNFTVTAQDQFGNTVPTYSGTVQFASSDGKAALPASAPLLSGLRQFSATLNSGGSQTITATDTVAPSLIGSSNSIRVAVRVPTRFAVVAPATATIGTAFNFTVTALDSSNIVVTRYSGTAHFTSTDSLAGLPSDSTLTNGTATFPAALNTLASQTISATDTLTASITGSSTSIMVAAATTENPVPLIYQPLSPDAILPAGGLAFRITVNGTGFVSGSTVQWNGSSRATTFVSNSKLTATVLATDVAHFSSASVTVANPPPGGGTSNALSFEITRPTSSVALITTSAFAAGSGPDSVATGDFNGDGKLDLAVANSSGNNVSIFLGKGDGTFQSAVDYSVGTAPGSIAVGDFNGDGKLDLATTNNVDNNVSILLGNGDGTFQTALTSSFVGVNPGSLAVGDINSDGKLDLVVGSNGATGGISSVSVLLGNGDGTFEPPLQYTAGPGVFSVAVADFNGDGKLDLAVVTVGTGLSVLLGNGNGTFQPPVSYPAGPVPVSLTVGDFNADGKLDLAVANIPSGNTGPSVVSVLVGNGDGTFQPSVEYPSGSGTYIGSSSVTLGDFNGDGKLDLAVANQGSSNRVSILLGNGDGTFQSAVDYPGGSAVMATGDFNGDGRLDLAILGAAGVSLMLQPGLASGTDAVLSPTSLNFDSQLLNTTSPAQSIQLANYGTTTLNIAGIVASTNYAESTTCSSSLVAGASCFITISFTPGAIGPLNGTLTITDSAPGSPHSVPLSGTGTEVQLSATSIRFGCEYLPGPNGPIYFCTGPQVVTVTNVGATSLVFTGIAVTGPVTQTNTCVAPLALGQSCKITVTWSSTHNVGNGVLSLTDNGGGSPQTVPITAFVQRR